jgi:hypothetical protein
VQITSQDPRVSTAGKFLTIAFLSLILFTLIAKTIVTTAGNHSGIAATAIATAVIKLSMIFSVIVSQEETFINDAINIMIAIHKTRKERYFAVFAS